MLKLIFCTALVLFLSHQVGRTQVVVNPDGSHSVLAGNVIVNPDGSHSVISGNVIVNPNGSHSVIAGNVLVNPNGTHSACRIGFRVNRLFIATASTNKMPYLFVLRNIFLHLIG